MRLGFYWTYAVRSLTRGGLRSLLGLLCVVVGVAAIVALQLEGAAFYQATAGNIRVATGGDIAVDDALTPLTPAQLQVFAQLKAQGKLAVYSPFSQHQGVASTASGARLNYFDLLAVDPATFPPGGGTIFVTPPGGAIASTVHGDAVALSQQALNALKAHVGDTLLVTSDDGRAASVVIAGVFEDTASYSYIQNGPFLLMDLSFYAQLPSTSHTPIGYTNVFADVPGHDPNTASAVAQIIQRRIPLSNVQSTKETAGFFQSQSATFQHFFQLAALMALLIGGVGIGNTITVMLRRRTVEIAMLKTMGYRWRDLYLLFGLESGLLGLVGGVIGAGVGVLASLIIKPILENAFGNPIPLLLDPVIIASGIAIGLVTALIFGLIPIVQASQVRPLTVLREARERRSLWSAVTTGLLLLLVVALFFGVAASVLGDVVVALASVIGGAVGLLALGAIFTVVVFLIGLLPVWLLPRRLKTDARMALRNISRQRGRSVVTAVALFVGVFAISLVVILGQYVQTQIATATARAQAPNAFILAGTADKGAVDGALRQITGANVLAENPVASALPGAVRGVSVADFVAQATGSLPGQAKHDAYWAFQGLTQVEGYDLAHGQRPDPRAISLTQGAQDSHMGRMLSQQDAGTNDTVLPVSASQAPLDFRLGDHFTLLNSVTKAPTTLTVIGFYQSTALSFTGGSTLADSDVVRTLGGQQLQYLYAVHFTNARLAADIQQAQAAAPNAHIVNFTQTAQAASATINKAANGLEAVAALALLAALISVANAVALAMLERRREIGVLKSIGYTSGHVLRGALLETGSLASVSSAIALGVAIALAYVVSPALSFARISAPFTVNIPLVVGVLVIATLICVAVAAVVAWGAAHVRPIEVLRYE